MERVVRCLFLILKTILRVLLRTEELGTYYTVLLFPKISLQFLQESLENSVRRRRFCSPRRALCAFFFFFSFIASFERRIKVVHVLAWLQNSSRKAPVRPQRCATARTTKISSPASALVGTFGDYHRSLPLLWFCSVPLSYYSYSSRMLLSPLLLARVSICA